MDVYNVHLNCMIDLKLPTDSWGTSHSFEYHCAWEHVEPLAHFLTMLILTISLYIRHALFYKGIILIYSMYTCSNL